ncbi:hypothetical protein KP509_37G014900 [Ceratopteris richardii]|nr:hypothetical protein KP509_37G014900 [Ceratopteris richardii]
MERRHRNSSFHFMNDNVSRSFRLQMEPDVYNDDEHLAQMVSSDTKSSLDDATGSRMYCNKLGIKVYSEVSSVPACESLESLTVLLHLNAPSAGTSRVGDGASSMFSQNTNSRAPIDLVAVLDTSGSMAGRKLLLLKQAMAFVIRNLSSVDRLSLVIFSSTAKRVFPLCRMGEEGQRQAIQSMDALMASGGTNIAEGLKKGVKILEDRRERNPISSIMLLSDGQDTYNINSGRQLSLLLGGAVTDSRRLVPRSIRSNSRGLGHLQIPIHTFGFGSDHDAATMHAISEVSGGTFSFIQAEETVQDAFAQCIGGLLSVVAQDVKLSISCLSPGVRINVIHAGSYQNSISNEGRCGTVELGDLYAEEQRDILVELQLPAFMSSNEAMPMPLLEAGCLYEEPVTREVNHISAEKLHIDRPLASKEVRQVVSLEVDRQRNRLRVAAVIAEARLLADEGNFEAAQSRLQTVRMQLEDSPSARAGDQLCTVLDFELKEMYERMASRQLYERSGRAYLLSAQSSHLRQRATTRGDSLDGFMHDYQTQSMVDMVTLSQMRSLLERNVVTATPSSSQRDMPRGRNAAAPTRSAGLSLFQKMSAKVLRSHGVG